MRLQFIEETKNHNFQYTSFKFFFSKIGLLFPKFLKSPHLRAICFIYAKWLQGDIFPFRPNIGNRILTITLTLKPAPKKKPAFVTFCIFFKNVFLFQISLTNKAKNAIHSTKHRYKYKRKESNNELPKKRINCSACNELHDNSEVGS